MSIFGVANKILTACLWQTLGQHENSTQKGTSRGFGPGTFLLWGDSAKAHYFQMVWHGIVRLAKDQSHSETLLLIIYCACATVTLQLSKPVTFKQHICICSSVSCTSHNRAEQDTSCQPLPVTAGLRANQWINSQVSSFRAEDFMKWLMDG